VAWRDEHAVGIGRLARAEQHTGYARFCRANAWVAARSTRSLLNQDGNRRDATALDDPPPSAAKHGAKRDDLRGRKRVLLIISPCK
jgi:hypothetical protein